MYFEGIGERFANGLDRMSRRMRGVKGPRCVTEPVGDRYHQLRWGRILGRDWVGRGHQEFTLDHVQFEIYVAHLRRDLKSAVGLRGKIQAGGIRLGVTNIYMDLKGMRLDKNPKDEVMVKKKDLIIPLSNFWTYCFTFHLYKEWKNGYAHILNMFPIFFSLSQSSSCIAA